MTKLKWLGQAGFEVVADAGDTLLIDPYLSDWCKEFSQNPRVPPIPIPPDAVRAEVVVASHWHEDHLDPGTIRGIAKASPGTVFVGPPSCALRCHHWGIDPRRISSLERGQSLEVGPFTITAGFARHEVPGMLTEDAISIAIDVDGHRIFHSGDTEYDARVKATRASVNIDVGLFVINGTGGNMNVREAAFLAAEMEVGLAIPMHYGMWRPEKYGEGATLDPSEFVTCFEAATGRRGLILQHAESVDIT